MPPTPHPSSSTHAVDRTTVAFVMTGELYRNSRALKQLRSLAAAGYHVDVFHLSGSAPALPLPDAISVHTLQRPAGSGPAFFRKVDRLFATALAGLTADIVHASDLYALSACRRRADETGASLTYDAREYYPHVAGTVGKPWARWWWRHLEKKHIGRADSVFTVSDSIADALSSNYGIDRPLVVHNAPPAALPTTDQPEPTLSERIGTDGPIFVHLGQMKAHRGGPSLIHAMDKIEEAHLVFLGYGSEMAGLQTLSREMGVADRVHFLDPVSPDAIRLAIRDARAGITMLEDTCLNHRFALPNKLFDYIHAGLPVLGANLDEVRSVVSRFEIGLTARPDQPADIARAMTAMLKEESQARWRGNLPKAAETFAWENASQRFLAGFERALERLTESGKDPSS